MFTYTCDNCNRTHELTKKAENVKPQLYLVTVLKGEETCETCFNNIEQKWIQETA